ncbi:hypothetical protein AC1031_008883 [Aphanomyces cochlioides]|nr:hypothetical protein AC1031_008883 [Aphanomyces cochlioides]
MVSEKQRAINAWKEQVFAADPVRAEAWKQHDLKLHQFIKESVPEALAHTGEVSFDEHLVGVQSVLRAFGADEEIAKAGLFHSLYGTEGFQGYKFPILRRPEIRSLIGARAERMVWMFCVVDRKTFDDAVFAFEASKPNPDSLLARPELGRFPLPLRSDEEWLDFIEMVLADYIEQIEGAAEKANPVVGWEIGEAWAYRRTAYLKMADVLSKALGERGARIKQIVEDVYSRESNSTKHIVQEVTPTVTEAARDARDALKSIDL